MYYLTSLHLLAKIQKTTASLCSLKHKLAAVTCLPNFSLCQSKFLFRCWTTNRAECHLKKAVPLVCLLKTNL